MSFNPRERPEYNVECNRRHDEACRETHSRADGAESTHWSWRATFVRPWHLCLTLCTYLYIPGFSTRVQLRQVTPFVPNKVEEKTESSGSQSQAQSHGINKSIPLKSRAQGPAMQTKHTETKNPHAVPRPRPERTRGPK